MSLSIKNLNYSIEEKPLLKDINAQILRPKFIGIIGPNGAGKSTLLNCISGLLGSKKSVELNHRHIETHSNIELALVRAALPQSSDLSFPFVARDIVAMSFALSNLSITQQDQLIDQSLKILSATDLATRNYLSLSGGEKQRIQLARVLAQLSLENAINHMRLLLLDEPTAPLDLKYQFLLFNHLKLLVKQNISTIAVIHDINLAAAYCDEIWVMHQGELIIQDTPQVVISSDMMKLVFEVDVNVSFDHHQLHPSIRQKIQNSTDNIQG